MYVVDPPAGTIAEVEAPGAAAIEKSTAVPERGITWGEVEALSVTVKVPAELPTAVGSKVAVMVHEEAGASEEPQVLVSAKPPLVPGLPAATMLVIFSGKLPVLARVTGAAVVV